MTIEPGQWVTYVWMERVRNGSDQFGIANYRNFPHRENAKVVSVNGDQVMAESWEVAKLTHRSKVFGQKIDKTPFRVGGTYCLSIAKDKVQPVAASVAVLLERKLAKVAAYPTKAQRDYARAKRRKQQKT